MPLCEAHEADDLSTAGCVQYVLLWENMPGCRSSLLALPYVQQGRLPPFFKGYQAAELAALLLDA